MSDLKRLSGNAAIGPWEVRPRPNRPMTVEIVTPAGLPDAADLRFAAALVNAYRAGRLVEREVGDE